MSEQTPYEKLGVTEAASFEEIQDAKNRLTQEYRDNSKAIESIEAAYDSIIMERLRMRQEGRIKVPERIRFPERTAEIPPSPPSLSLNNSPPWLQRLIDTPSSKDILLPAGVFLLLAGFAAFSQGNPSLLPLLLSLGVFANVYFLNRKEQKFGRSLVMTFVGLLLGVGLGIGLVQLLQASNLITGTTSQLPLSLVVLFLFWVLSSFLR